MFSECREVAHQFLNLRVLSIQSLPAVTQQDVHGEKQQPNESGDQQDANYFRRGFDCAVGTFEDLKYLDVFQRLDVGQIKLLSQVFVGLFFHLYGAF